MEGFNYNTIHPRFLHSIVWNAILYILRGVSLSLPLGIGALLLLGMHTLCQHARTRTHLPLSLSRALPNAKAIRSEYTTATRGGGSGGTYIYTYIYTVGEK